MVGVRCGNRVPRSEWTPRERQIVSDFERYLHLVYEEDQGTITAQDFEWLKNYRAINAPTGASRQPVDRASENTNRDRG